MSDDFSKVDFIFASGGKFISKDNQQYWERNTSGSLGLYLRHGCLSDGIRLVLVYKASNIENEAIYYNLEVAPSAKLMSKALTEMGALANLSDEEIDKMCAALKKGTFLEILVDVSDTEVRFVWKRQKDGWSCIPNEILSQLSLLALKQTNLSIKRIDDKEIDVKEIIQVSAIFADSDDLDEVKQKISSYTENALAIIHEYYKPNGAYPRRYKVTMV